jgi:recombination protein RecA
VERKRQVPKKAAAPLKDMTADELEKLVNKKWPGAIKRASDPSLVIERIPCGVLSVDWLLGGGFARGRYTELFGSSNVGKNSLAYRLIGNAQDMGLQACFFNTEDKFEPVYAEHLGVDLRRLSMVEQDDMERAGNQLLDIMETRLRTHTDDLIVMDSIAALLALPELENPLSGGGTFNTDQARLMSRGLRKLTTANRRTCIIFINQVRDKVGSIFGGSVTSGGRAMGFYAGCRLELVRTETLKRSRTIIKPNGEPEKQSTPTGHRVLVKVAKDQTGGAREGDTTTFVFSYEKSNIDDVEDLIYIGLQTGLVHKSGTNWCVDGYEDEKQQGRLKFYRWLGRNRAVAEELYERICEAEPETDSDEEEDDE